jgi:hypothetical protein
VQDAFSNGIQLAYIPVFNLADAESMDLESAISAWGQTNYTISAEVNMKSNTSALNEIKEWLRGPASGSAGFHTSGVL